MPSRKERLEHEGRLPQPGVPSGPRNTAPPSRHSGGTSGDLTVKGHVTETPVVTSSPSGKTTGVKAIVGKKKRKRKKKTGPTLSEILEPLKETEVPEDPGTALMNAKNHGIYPDESLKKNYGPEAYKRAFDAASKHADEHEGLKEDPAAEFVISTAATAGLGAAASGAAKLAGAGAESFLAKGGATLASKEATAAESAAEKAGKKLIARVKGSPKAAVKRGREYPGKKVAQVKALPSKAKAAPAAAKRAATTSEGRRAAARGAARTAVRHPIKTGVPAAAVLPPGILPGDASDRARAFFRSAWDATSQHPVQTAEMTGRGALGFVAAPLALGGAAIKSAAEGDPETFLQTAGGLIYQPAEPKSKGGTGRPSGLIGTAENLASGDPKKVEETILTESGLTPFIPVPHLVKRAKGTDLYQDTRGVVRATVEGKRAKTREGRIAAEKAAVESGGYVKPPKVRGRIRQSVGDTARPGEKYVLRRTGKFREKQRSRHGVSRHVTRMQEAGDHWGKKAAKPIIDELKKSKLATRGDHNVSDALRLVVKYGIPKDAERGKAAVHDLLKTYPATEHGDIPAGVFLDRHAAQYLADHDQVWSDKHFWNAVDQFKAQAEKVGTSPRNRFLASANSIVNPRRAAEGKHPVLLPEERIPAETSQLLPKRSAPWSRSEALTYAAQTKDRALAKEINASLDGLMKPPEHGGAEGGVSTTRAEAWTPQMRDAFVREMRAEHKRMGLDQPAAYVADTVPSANPDKAPDYGGKIPARKVWPSRGKAAASGNAESRFESLLLHSVHNPRMRRAVNEGLSRIFDQYGRKVGGKRYLTRAQAEHAINTHQVPEGTIFLRTQFLKGALEGDHPVGVEHFHDLFRGEVEHGERLASSSGAELRSELVASQKLKGEKYAPMDAAAINELVGQMAEIPGLSKFMGKVSNFSTRAILNSPAFLAVQIPQEGIPLLASLGRNIAHVPGAIRALRKISKLDPEFEAQIKAVVGSSAGVQGAPDLRQLSTAGVLDPVRAAAPAPVWRHLWNVINGNVTGKLDRQRAGIFREVAAAAKVEGDFRRWRKGMYNLFSDEADATKAMEGMNREQRLAYVAAHPTLGDKLMKSMNEAAGNWNSFTTLEKHFSPLTIFYPFQRYSVLWMLYHFPLNHPVVATAMHFLGQMNANELEKIARSEGASIDNPLAFTFPVIKTGPGPVTKDNTQVLPVGSRVFPGLGSIQQAIVEGKPAEALGVLTPVAQIAASAAYGKDPFTGQPLDENGWEYMARQIVSLSPAARYLGVNDVGKGKPSAISEAFSKLDSRRDERSVLNPTAPQSGADFATEQKLSEALKESAENNSDAIKQAAHDAAAEGGVLLYKDRKAMEKKGDTAQNTIEHILKQLGLSDEDRKEYKRYLRGMYGHAEEETGGGIGGGQGEGIGGGGADTGPIGGPGSLGARPVGKIGGNGKVTVKMPKQGQAKKASIKVPKIEGFEHDDQKEFAEYLSHYSGLPPKLAGEWVKQEGGGFSNGGEAGEQNWLGVGYPGEQTAMSQSHYFNGVSPREAAKNTALWMEGKIGSEYSYQAADSIQGIARLAKEGAPESTIRAYIEGPSAWGTGAIVQSGIMVNGKQTVRGGEAKPAKKRKGEWAGTKDILLKAAKGIPISSTKRSPAHNAEIGGSSTSDHLTTNENTFATDLPTTDGVPIADKVTKRLGISGWTPGNYDWYTTPKYPGYRFQVLWEVEGHYDHVHIGAEWTGEDLPAGTVLGGSVGSGSTSFVASSGGAMGSSSAGSPEAVGAGSKAKGMKVKARIPTARQNYNRTTRKLKALSTKEEAPEEASPALEELRKRYKAVV